MIYYPLSTLMLAGIKDILIISTPEDTSRFEHLLGDGAQFGINLTYAVQPTPDGCAQAFIIGEEFIGDDACAMILGDNIFYGSGFSHKLKSCVENAQKGIATVFGYYVNDPERFGVVESRCHGKGDFCGRKAAASEEQLCDYGTLFLSGRCVVDGKRGKAIGTWRAGDHIAE